MYTQTTQITLFLKREILISCQIKTYGVRKQHNILLAQAESLYNVTVAYGKLQF